MNLRNSQLLTFNLIHSFSNRGLVLPQQRGRKKCRHTPTCSCCGLTFVKFPLSFICFILTTEQNEGLKFPFSLPPPLNFPSPSLLLQFPFPSSSPLKFSFPLPSPLNFPSPRVESKVSKNSQTHLF